MLKTAYQPSAWPYKAKQPRSFRGLMALYESNYRRFIRLLPEAPLPFNQAVSKGVDHDLHLNVIQRCRYTTTVHLTHWLRKEGAYYPDPDLQVRVYHDAQLAEAIYCDASARYMALAGVPDIDDEVLEAQWPRNQLLNKWLAYCLQQGHNFCGAQRPRNDQAAYEHLELRL